MADNRWMESGDGRGPEKAGLKEEAKARGKAGSKADKNAGSGRADSEKAIGVNRRRVGTHYEQLAANYLRSQGVTILERNYRCPRGEIDLIGLDGRYLVFVEVKYRRDGRQGDPSEAVTGWKQRRICQTARYYLYGHRYGEDTPCRFDVISIRNEEIRWIKNAFCFM